MRETGKNVGEIGERGTIPCECGGRMVRQDYPIPDPCYPVFFCERCGSWSDGLVFYPSEEFCRCHPSSEFCGGGK